MVGRVLHVSRFQRMLEQEMGVETFEKPVWKDRSPLGP